MKNINIKYIIASAFLILATTSCKDQDFDDYKIQSVDNHGSDHKIISMAVTATSNAEFVVVAVNHTPELIEYSLLPVVLNSKDGAPEDIHVKLVPAQDSLDSYNARNKTKYIMADSPGAPVYTLLDDAVVTIPKGSNVGYLKIKAVSNDFLGSTSAFAYKIESVQEPGYTISGNHKFGIVVFIGKNDYDGLYQADGELIGHQSASGPIDYKDFKMATSGLYNLIFNAVAGTNTTFTSVEVEATIDPATNLVSLVATANGVPLVFADAKNHYDPETKTFYLHFGWGSRDETLKLTYTGPR